MNSIWLSLLWKEWWEFRWKLAALTGIVLAVPTVILLIICVTDGELSTRRLLEGIIFFSVLTLSPYLILAGMFVGMMVAAGENSRRTMRFLRALPMPMWQAALIKLLIATLVVSLPILIVMGVVWIFGAVVDPQQELLGNAVRELPKISPPWGNTTWWYVDRSIASILAVCSLLLWTAVFGMNRSDEVRAGAVAFLVIVVAWGCWAFAMDRADRYSLPSIETVLQVLRVALPGGLATPRIGPAKPTSEMIMAIAAHLVLLVWLLRRFGKVPPAQKGGGGLQISDMFRFKTGNAPWQTSLQAIAWKQMRETGPLVLVAIVAIAGIVLLFLFADPESRRIDEMSKLLAGLGIGFGVIVALVAGVGVLLEDYGPGVNSFWRSRPINVHLWFVVKHLTGLLVLTACFGAILILANALSGWSLGDREDAGYIAMYFFGCYTLALCGFALVRQPIYAVILAMATPFAAAMCYQLVGHVLNWQHKMWYDVAATLIGLVAATLLAWQAVVRDWGWKQHR